MAHPDLQINGGGGHPDPEIRVGGDSLKKNFSALWTSVWSKKLIRGSGPQAPPLDPPLLCPTSGILPYVMLSVMISFILHNVIEEGFLKRFIESTKSLSPEEKGAKLESDEVETKFYALSF